MPHGEMQLVAYGAQDIYLTGNPSITFFKFVYKKHTNFATEYIRKDFESIPNFNTENRTKVRCNIERRGQSTSDLKYIATNDANVQWWVDGVKQTTVANGRLEFAASATGWHHHYICIYIYRERFVS